VYRWRKEDAEFAAGWTEAVEEGLDLVEERLYRRALYHNDALLLPICVHGGRMSGRARIVRRARTRARVSMSR
jgi:hypothetical protein